jgi:hypothetical protein
MRRVARAIVSLLVSGALLGGALLPAGAQRDADPHRQPVKSIGPLSFTVATPEGGGVLRYFSTGSLEGDARATRAIIDIHGLLRNAGEYETSGEATIAAAHEPAGATLLVTPQFLAQVDVTGSALPADTLRWDVSTWLEGEPAVGPAPVSAFSVLDAMLERLAERERFPALREIVVLGHSAGAQLLQRYAVVGRAPDSLAARPGSTPLPAVRFIVADPSSYLYFTSDRPAGDSFAPFDATACPVFNRWKYGLDRPPPYVTGNAGVLEAGYVKRDVTYLLGLRDDDPNHPVLDKSCAGEAEGPNRLARGRAYVQYLRRRHPDGTNQSFAEVAGVGHDELELFTSSCGIAVLFDRPRTTCARAARV